MSAEQQYIEFYQENGAELSASSSAVLNAYRDEAFRYFCKYGFPSKKVERFRYTDVARAFEPDYGIKIQGKAESADNGDAALCLEKYYSTVATLPEGAESGLLALNTMLVQSCIVIHVKRNEKKEHPIQVNNVLAGEHMEMVSRRILIVMEEGAEADVIITDRAASQTQFLTNQVIEVVCGDNSRLGLYEIEETHMMCNHFSSVYMNVGRDCSVRHTNLSLFNGRSRNSVDVRLQGEHSEVTLNGCVIIDKMQHVDNNTLIDHQVPNCVSRELYKYVLDDSAVGAFAGRVLVREGAQKTVSQETNANLCATKTARMYTQPMLEIYADDVKCAHGSTVGQINDAALFYMRQRGISEQEARLLLKSAFITEVIETIPLTNLRDRLHVLVEKRLRGELSKCEGCKLCK